MSSTIRLRAHCSLKTANYTTNFNFKTTVLIFKTNVSGQDESF